MTDQQLDLAEAFKRAAELAALVPEQLQESAFNRALDVLLSDPAVSSGRRESAGTAGRAKVTGASGKAPAKHEVLSRLLSEIDSSGAPEVHDASTLRDRCLWVLKIAKDRYDVDGLTPYEVQRLLTDKFRIRAGEREVRRALADSGRLVDRTPEGRAYRYRLMAAGETHLLSGPDKPPEMPVARSKPRRPKVAAQPQNPVSTDREAEIHAVESDSPKKKARRDATAAGRGPTAIIRDMIAAGWFSTGRSVNDILTELARRGATYKRTDLTRLVVTLVRSEELQRDKAPRPRGRAVWHYTAPGK